MKRLIILVFGFLSNACNKCTDEFAIKCLSGGSVNPGGSFVDDAGFVDIDGFVNDAGNADIAGNADKGP